MDELIEGGNFRCYSDNTLFNYTSNISPTCDYLTTSVNITEPISDQVSVFPNPSNGLFSVDFDQPSNISEIKVTDMLGNIVNQQKIDNKKKINIDNLPSGVYILSVIDKDCKIINKKIISSP